MLLAAREYDVWWTALSQLANLAVAVCFLGLAWREPRSPWLRGALASVMLLVSLAYLPLANGNLAEPWSILEHIVTPLLVVAGFALLAVGPAGARDGDRRRHALAGWSHELAGPDPAAPA